VPDRSDHRGLLSAVIIVRDEAAFLRRCLSSIRAVCDEIVVVDTGSTDDTVAVAESFGAVVDHRPWDDDFAAARNRSLELATGEWVLYIDADEQLEHLDPERARAELRTATDAVCLLVRFRSRPIFSPYREYRLWRNRDDIRFVGRIHETMVPDLARIERTTDLVIRDSDEFSIVHWGYEGDQTHKHLRNLPLLERRVVELPDRVYLWHHLGNVRDALGDHDGAEAAWREGIDVIRRLGVQARTDVLCYGSLGVYLVERGVDAGDLAAEMLAVAPWYLSGHWVAASNHRARHRHAEAIEHLHALLAVGSDPIDGALAYNNGMFTDWAWDALGDSLYQLGDVAGAAAVFVAAAEQRPESRAFRAKAIAMSSYAAVVAG
jgi:tetratricopeptide (TPR) repeat protein